MPDEKPSDDPTPEEIWEGLTADRPISPGYAAAIYQAANNEDHPYHEQLKRDLGIKKPTNAPKRDGIGSALTQPGLSDALTDGIKESKSSYSLPGATDQADQKAEREQTEAIKESKSNLVWRPGDDPAFRKTMADLERGVAAMARRQERERQEAMGPVKSPEPDKGWPEDPLIKDSRGVADRAIEMRKDAERATATGKKRARMKTAGATKPPPTTKTDLPVWAKWVLFAVAVVGLGFTAVRVLFG
jgi:hypothetical protein